MRRQVFAIAVTLLCAFGAHSFSRAGAEQPAWSEVPWPFPIDQWGRGKAYTCAAADCGAAVTLYVRAKIGFCNCSTGVADDAELDRISDFDLIGSPAIPHGPGRPIAVGWMQGRSRAFDIAGPLGRRVSALSVGFNDKCDAVVATAVAASGGAASVEPAVLAFLNSRTVLAWAETALGL
jgi:hypothetical protein